MPYVIDTCSFIELKNNYRESIFPDVWRNVKELLEQKELVTSHFVYEEIKRNAGDRLFELIKQHDGIFVEPSEAIQKEAKEVLRQFPGLIRVQKRKSGADPFVIATAEVLGAPVVTEEKKSGDIIHPHIPDVCERIGLKCLRLIDVFELEGYRFVNQ